MTMRLRSFVLLASFTVAIPVVPIAALAACGGSTAFPQCDDTCPPGLVCADSGGSCGCVALPGVPCGDPANPGGPNDAPACYGGCANPAKVCGTLAGGCACIPTLSEWGIMAMSLVMFGSVLWLRRRDAGRERG